MFNPSVKLAQVFASYLSSRGGKMKPKEREDFYTHIEIPEPRFESLLSGREALTLEEARRVADFFQIKITELI